MTRRTGETSGGGDMRLSNPKQLSTPPMDFVGALGVEVGAFLDSLGTVFGAFDEEFLRRFITGGERNTPLSP